MKRHELDLAIRNNSITNAVMLYGESHFLIEYYKKRLMQIDDANVLSLYHDEYHASSAKEHLSQGSLFGDRNVLLIKSEKKIPKADLDILIALCKKNPDNYLIYSYFGSDFKTSHKAFTKKAGGEAIRLFNPYEKEAKSIIMQEAMRLNINLDHYSAGYLFESQNGDLSLACNELSKLQLLEHPISPKDIDELVFGLAEVKIDQFLKELMEKHDFKVSLHHLLESGEDEIRLLTSISTYLTQLYLFNCQAKISGVANSAAVLGYKLPNFIEKERAALSIRLPYQIYKQGLSLLLACEFEMKSSSNHDKNSLLLSTLLRFQSIL
ncbi:MAG: DNA polymerase III subunit delta [Campylobacterota bacterium]|nr:DNA polymerase III subunit delta [Campylobacterota bacterium]